MNRTILTSALFTSAACTLLRGADAKTADAVKAAERAWGAATAAADGAVLEKLLADDLTYTHSNGETDTKAVFIGNMKSGARRYHEVNYESVEARLYNNSAVVMAVANIKTSQKGATPAPAHLRFLHFWVYQKGAWRLAAHQSLRLPN
jgi:ketosteroid isomerase-like protein